MKRIIITMATTLLCTSLVACDGPIDEESELRAAELDVDPEDLDADEVVDEDGNTVSLACPADGGWTAGYPNFSLGTAEYWSMDTAECNGRKAIRGFCPSSMGGTTFNNQCGCGCVWSDNGGMQ